MQDIVCHVQTHRLPHASCLLFNMQNGDVDVVVPVCSATIIQSSACLALTFSVCDVAVQYSTHALKDFVDGRQVHFGFI